MDTEYIVDLLAAVAQYPPVSKQGGNNIPQGALGWFLPLWEICPTLPPRVDLQRNCLTGFNCATHGVLQHSFPGWSQPHRERVQLCLLLSRRVLWTNVKGKLVGNFFLKHLSGETKFSPLTLFLRGISNRDNWKSIPIFKHTGSCTKTPCICRPMSINKSAKTGWNRFPEVNLGASEFLWGRPCSQAKRVARGVLKLSTKESGNSLGLQGWCLAVFSSYYVYFIHLCTWD